MAQTFTKIPVAGIDPTNKPRAATVDADGHLAIVLAAGANLDAFGRLRIGPPHVVFDSKLINDTQPFYWDDAQISGAGTSSVFNTNQAQVTLAVSAAVAGTRVRQTFRRFNYQPGKASLVSATGVIGTPVAGITRRIGLFDANNGLFFESGPTNFAVVVRTKTSGAAVDTRIPQAAWNVDPLDGTGPSEIALDFTKVQIFVIDFQWLGVGTIRFGFFVDGILYYCHKVQNANIATLVYTSTPNLPLRYEIANSGAGGAASLAHICSTVVAEGGIQNTGSSRVASRGATALATLNNTSLYPLIAIRLKAGSEGVSTRDFIGSIVCTTNADFEWQLLVNPVVTGTALAFSPITNSYVEADVATTNATTVSGGTILQAGVVAANSFIDAEKQSDYALGVSIAGVADVLVLAVRRLTGTSETFSGVLNWAETN